ncbi:hypothetical protein SKAU_G00028170 [Synaphobranchus kaupii]|uniref:Serine/threonine-protein kinase WNK CCTL2 domain-containing protein n=1 Tax=Synaphobranchus kaupii TaxID=118154 RepID=A0A9Q1GD95_SYNKA|nr:hypothetical protein SKAU_G00028170 [Synaphobranchus kaupii]
MSLCVPCISALPLSCPPKQPSTPPPAPPTPLSPRLGSPDGETFAGRLSKALECVLPLHSVAPRRRASLPALFASPVCQCTCRPQGGVTQDPPPQSVTHQFSGGVPALPDPPIFFPTILERPVSFSPPPSCPPKMMNVQRRKSTSILEAHTRHFQPTYRTYGSSLHPFAGAEGMGGAGAEPSLLLVPGVAGQWPAEPLHAQNPAEQLYGYKDVRAEPPQQEEVVRRLSLNQAALLDHFEAMAYGGYPVTAHQLSQLGFHQQMQAAGLGYDTPQPSPGYLHPHMQGHVRLTHSPIPPLTPMSASSLVSSAPAALATADPCYPQVSFPHSAPPMLAHTGEPVPAGVFEFHVHNVSSDPSLLASRLYRARRGSMDLNLEEQACSPAGLSGRLQPVTEELYSYVSPELPLPPGSLLLHGPKDRSPEPSSDSMASSDAGEFHSPPPHGCPPPGEASAAQSIPHTSYYGSDSGGTATDAHPPSQPSFLFVPPSEAPGTTASHVAMLHGAWARHTPYQPDLSYHESALALQGSSSQVSGPPVPAPVALAPSSQQGPAPPQQYGVYYVPPLPPQVAPQQVPVSLPSQPMVSLPLQQQGGATVTQSSQPHLQPSPLPAQLCTSVPSPPVLSSSPSVEHLYFLYQAAQLSLVQVQWQLHLGGCAGLSPSPGARPYGLAPPPSSTGQVSVAQVGFPPPSLPVSVAPGLPPQQAPAAVVSPLAVALPVPPAASAALPPPNAAQLPPQTMPQQLAPVAVPTVHAGTVPAELPFQTGDTPHQTSQSLPHPLPSEQTQGQTPQVPSSMESGHSDVASGLSDGNEGASATGGRHEGRSAKRHQRRSVRSRSRHEKTGKAKLNVLNISNIGDRVAECQLETHNRKMVTFKFDLDGDNPEEIAEIMVLSEFILESERESFIEQVREVIDMADDKGLEREGMKDGYSQMAQEVPVIAVPLQSGDSQSSTTQVVHSAGRRFIVSPVPESRLREQFFGPPAATPPVQEAPAAAAPAVVAPGLGLSHSASTVSLQQAFSEMRQAQYDPGPSTAPPCVQVPNVVSVAGLAVDTSVSPSGPSSMPVTSPPLLQALAPITGAMVPAPASLTSHAQLAPPAQPPMPHAQPAVAAAASAAPPPPSSMSPPAMPQPQNASTSFPVTSPPGLQPAALAPTASETQAGGTGAEGSEQPSLAPPVPASPGPCTVAQALPLTPATVPSTALPSSAAGTPVLTPSAVPPLLPQGASLLPVSANVPVVQPTLVHGQPQPSPVPNQSHAHCGECEGDPQGKTPGVDDIQALDKKLRSLFSDLGSGLSSAQPDASGDPTSSPGVPGTSSPTGTTSSTSGGPLPPNTLPLGPNGQPTTTPAATPGQTATPASYGQTTPAKTTLSRVPVLPVGSEQAGTTPIEQLAPFPGPCLTQSQQPLEDLDAQLRRALSPETVPISSVTAQSSVIGMPSGGQPVPFSLAAEGETADAPTPAPAGFQLGRFQVSVAAEEAPGHAHPTSSDSSSSSTTRSSSSSTPSSSSLSSPENTLHKASSPLRRLGGDMVDGLPQRPPAAAATQPTTIGRFQVTTNADTKPAMANGPALSPDTKASLPSLNNSFNSYVSSDNDSEFEDEDFKREVNRLRDKHMKEIQALHTKQKEEIDSLFTRLGKVPPPVVIPPMVAPAGRRRRPTKKSSRSSSQSSKSPLQPGTLAAQSAPSVENLCSAFTSEAALSMPTLCAPTAGTSSTNTVSGSGQSQSQNQQPAALPTARKGTFTDDLHKLVDNWARDAMSLSQGKRGSKQGSHPQASSQAHNYDVIPPANMGRKFSAPGQLCPSIASPLSGPAALPNTPATSLGARKGSLCPPPQYGFTSATYGGGQWAGSVGHTQAGLLATSQPLGQFQSVAPASLQSFHISTLQKSVSNPGGPNLRTTPQLPCPGGVCKQTSRPRNAVGRHLPPFCGGSAFAVRDGRGISGSALRQRTASVHYEDQKGQDLTPEAALQDWLSKGRGKRLSATPQVWKPTARAS